MNPITISPKSLHYRLATFYGPFSQYALEHAENYGIDSCRYIRGVMKGVFLALFIIVVASLALSGPVDGLAWLAVYMQSSVPANMIGPNGWAIILFVEGVVLSAIVIFCLLAGIIHLGVGVYEKLTGGKKAAKEPGPVKQLFQSWKDKYCVPIEIKEESSE